MKEPSDSVICVIDRGTFFPTAVRLSKSCNKVFYSNPEGAYSDDIAIASKGDGHPNIELVEDYWRIKNDVDVWVVPDCSDVGPQLELKSQGRAVWGSMAASDLERFRGRWIDLCKELGLPLPETKRIQGVSALRSFFKKHSYEEWYIKVSRWRGGCFETWKACEPAQIEHKIDLICVRAGPLKEQIVFYVQKKVDTEIEDGIDTFSVNGLFPQKIVWGFERKALSYLATWKERSELTEQWDCMESVAPILAEYGYTNFLSSELRRTKDKCYWLDPTFRQPSPAGEEQLRLYKNLPEIIVYGAQGELVEPEMSHKFCGEAIISYTGDRDGWKAFEVPDEVKEFVDLYACVYADGAYHFGPTQEPECIGTAVGLGDTPEEVIDQLKEIRDAMKNAPVDFNIEAMGDLISEIKTVEEVDNTEFAKEMPPLETVLED